MFHMLTCFNLKPEFSIGDFQMALDQFSTHMEARDLMVATGRIGRRQKHEIMDTDDERDHQYFFISSFRDRAQCDLAVEYITPHTEPGESGHQDVYAKIMDPVFICWEDV